MLECILKRKQMKRLRNIRRISLETLESSLKSEKNPKNIVKELLEYVTFNKGKKPEEVLTYRAMDKGIKFANHLNNYNNSLYALQLENDDFKGLSALEIKEKERQKMETFMYNAGMERIKPFTDEILSPLKIAQERVISVFDSYHKKNGRN